MSKEFKPRDTEFFECDCYGKDHLIRAEYSIFSYKIKDGTTHKDRDLNITFETRVADYDYDYRWSENIFSRFWHKSVWRIKKMFTILVKGEITTEGYFQPSRSFVDSNKEEVEPLFGYKTTKNFAKWLDTMADRIKADYEQDMKDYTIDLMQKELDSDKKVGFDKSEA